MSASIASGIVNDIPSVATSGFVHTTDIALLPSTHPLFVKFMPQVQTRLKLFYALCIF
jgi:hypothetical protein